MTTLSPPATPVAMPRSDTENPVFETEKSGADGGDGGSNYVESWVPRELRITDLPFMRGIQTYKTIKYQVVEEPMLALLAFVVKITVLIYVTILMTHYHTYNATASPTSVSNFASAIPVTQYAATLSLLPTCKRQPRSERGWNRTTASTMPLAR